MLFTYPHLTPQTFYESEAVMLKKRIAQIAIITATAFALASCDQLGLGGAESRLKRVQAELDATNFGKADELLTSLEAKSPSNPDVIFARAELESARGNVSGAVDALRRFLKGVPDGFRRIESSSRFDPIRDQPDYVALILLGRIGGDTDSRAGSSAAGSAEASSEASGGVSIVETNDRQEIRAGDVSISISK